MAALLWQQQQGLGCRPHLGSRPLLAARPLHARRRCLQAASSAQPRPLLLDNYDSYTYNLYQIIAEAYGVEPLVLHNDEVDIVAVQQLLAAGDVHHIILSPGPGTPHNPQDIGVCLDVLQQCTSTPVLGVCLGQQAMAVAAGGRVVRAPEPVHGRLSSLVHTGHELFAGCPSGPGSGFDVVRYHSLVVDAASLPPELEPLAWTCGSSTQAVSLDQPAAVVPPADALHVHTDQPEAAALAAAAAAAAGSPDSLIMALRHRQRPHYGVQFHPESVATRYGVQLLYNFRDIAARHSGQQQQQKRSSRQQLNLVGPPGRELPARPWPAVKHSPAAAAAAASSSSSSSLGGPQHQQQQQQQPQAVPDLASLGPASGVGAAGLQLLWQKLPGAAAAVAGGSAALFSELVGPGPDTFWLDSSSAPERARFSFMGGPGLGMGPLWHRVTYKLPVPSAQAAGSAATAAAAAAPGQQPGLLCVSQGASVPCQQQEPLPQPPQQQEQAVRASVFDYLQTQLVRLQLEHSCATAAAAELPFNFWGGFVGYLGYELKAECGGANAHAAPGPDAAWLFADRLLAVDHHLGDVWLLALAPAGPSALAAHQAAGGEAPAAGAAAAAGDSSTLVPTAAAAAAAQQWLRVTASRVQRLAAQQGLRSAGLPAHQQQQQQQQQEAAPRSAGLTQQGAQLREGREAYVANVAACKEALVAGDSYELCLTTSYTVGGAGDVAVQPPEPWAFYSALRSINPAPYSAWLSLPGSTAAAGITVCCSSPERFLSCGRGGVLEAKPIKGTARRHPGDVAADCAAAAALLGSEKERAENLMIVDLLRNDLGRVCEPGSVHVPGLIQLESYSSVHQLVSTVRGLLRPDASCVDAVRAAFPGGSMTGAPKVRSMELLDQLEGGARGVYSGALGYLSVNDTFDLNIVIRTAVFVDQPAGPSHTAGSSGDSTRSSGSSNCGAGRVMTVGAGGAITVQSDPEAEFAEMQLKAERLLSAVALAQQQPRQQQHAQLQQVQPPQPELQAQQQQQQEREALPSRADEAPLSVVRR